MWRRSELKRRAKDVLRHSYWKAFLVSLILAFVGGGSGAPRFNFGNLGGSDSSGWESDFDISAAFIIIGIIIACIVLVLVLAFRVLLGFPLQVGSMRYFNQAAENEVNLNHLGFAFKSGIYWDIVKAMFWRGLLNFLWYLLLIIPGIVKSYSYSMVPFLLADNPNIGSMRALTLSRQMTRGHKFRIFVLDLSFILWILLGILALFVGVLFVLPYINATKAELYLELRRRAIESGFTSEDELGCNPTLLT